VEKEMNLEDFKKQKNDRPLSEHELDQDQLERLIEEKFKRARAYHLASRQRDDEPVESD
jgi:hypothetical protein